MERVNNSIYLAKEDVCDAALWLTGRVDRLLNTTLLLLCSNSGVRLN